MTRQVQTVTFPGMLPKEKRVAAYARVSTDKDAMRHSLSAQVSYYSDLIQSTPGWYYAGVYSDDAISGTKSARAGFQDLIRDCRSGKIDMVICKSISRFARNTLTLLETVRELKGLSIDVFFEEQNLHTLSSEGEVMLTILAGFAEEESLSVSENMKWRIKKNFEAGIPWDGTLLGYRLIDGKYEIEPDEAEIVKFIYSEYLSGKGTAMIANDLNDKGVSTRFGCTWCNSTVIGILKNSTYTGNLILQKTYRENHLTKKKLKNTGQFPKYAVTDSHDAIISQETFDAVQEEFRRRQAVYGKAETKTTYPLTGKIRCGICGKNYRRKKRSIGITWMCTTYNTHGKAACPSKQIPEDAIMGFADELGGLVAIRQITANPGNEIIFEMQDGICHSRIWKDRSRSESWTDEMKEKARERSKQNGKRNSNTCKR